MTRWTGRLEFRDLEGGVWLLHTPRGVYTLRGNVPARLAGQQVQVEGEPDDGFGFTMTGPAITVQTVRAV